MSETLFGYNADDLSQDVSEKSVGVIEKKTSRRPQAKY